MCNSITKLLALNMLISKVNSIPQNFKLTFVYGLFAQSAKSPLLLPQLYPRQSIGSWEYVLGGRDAGPRLERVETCLK